MSWDATLSCPHAELSSWNYTHNTNRMIAAAMESAGYGKVIGPAWWDRLNGLSGAEGHFLLRGCVDALLADPHRYQAMNPPNGWGDYDSLVKVLSDMRDTCAVEDPSLIWEVTG